MKFDALVARFSHSSSLMLRLVTPVLPRGAVGAAAAFTLAACSPSVSQPSAHGPQRSRARRTRQKRQILFRIDSRPFQAEAGRQLAARSGLGRPVELGQPAEIIQPQPIEGKLT
jgi:hypothetical protein